MTGVGPPFQWDSIGLRAIGGPLGGCRGWADERRRESSLGGEVEVEVQLEDHLLPGHYGAG